MCDSFFAHAICQLTNGDQADNQPQNTSGDLIVEEVHDCCVDHVNQQSNAEHKAENQPGHEEILISLWELKMRQELIAADNGSTSRAAIANWYAHHPCASDDKGRQNDRHA